MSLHLGIAATMSIPNFSLIMLISYLLFCESSWLVALESKLVTSEGRSSLMLPPFGNPLWLVLAATRENDISIDQSKRLQSNGYSTWEIFSDRDKRYRGKSAWGRLATHLPLGFVTARMFRSELVCRLVWNWMGWCVRRMSLPQPEHKNTGSTQTLSIEYLWVGHVTRSMIAIIISALLFGVFWSNLDNLVKQDERELVAPVPASMSKVIRFSGLWQRWNLFAPYPRLVDGWIVAPGKFEDGVVIDLRSGEAVNDKMRRWFCCLLYTSDAADE